MSHTCGSCNQCCKLTTIPELNKPAGQWCKLVQIGVGCGDYENRPGACRAFECCWLQNQTWPDDMRPDQSGLVFFTPDGKEFNVLCDPHRRDAWKKGFAWRMIQQLVRHNCKVIVRTGESMDEIGKGSVI